MYGKNKSRQVVSEKPHATPNISGSHSVARPERVDNVHGCLAPPPPDRRRNLQQAGHEHHEHRQRPDEHRPPAARRDKVRAGHVDESLHQDRGRHDHQERPGVIPGVPPRASIVSRPTIISPTPAGKLATARKRLKASTIWL